MDKKQIAHFPGPTTLGDVTQHARKGLPLNPDELLTEAGGQVLGLGRGAVQAVLNRHGITRVLAAEGGRTSRQAHAEALAVAARHAPRYPRTLDTSEACDVDTFCDWLYSKCLGEKPVSARYVPRNAAALADIADGMTVPELLALAMYPAVEVAGVGMVELVRRFEASSMSAAHTSGLTPPQIESMRAVSDGADVLAYVIGGGA